MKSCTACLIEKTDDSFGRNSTKAGGLETQCKQCVADARKRVAARDNEVRKAWRYSTGRSGVRKPVVRKLTAQNPYKRLSKIVGNANYRARRRGAGGSLSKEDWVALCAEYGCVCLACLKQKPLTIDHVIPLTKGGSNDISNIQPLCLACNSSKLDRHVDYRYI